MLPGRSKVHVPTNKSSSTPEIPREMECLVNRMFHTIQIDNHFVKVDHQIHEKRLKYMRRILHDTTKDEWMYDQVKI